MEKNNANENCTVSRKPLLKFVKEIELPPIGPFMPEEHFKITPGWKRETANLVIHDISDNLVKFICDILEPGEAEAIIRVHELSEPTVDGPILAGLDKNFQVGFNRMFQILVRQGRGQDGDLLVNNGANIFYIKGTDWSVVCGWTSVYDAWHIYDFPVGGLNVWGASFRTFSL